MSYLIRVGSRVQYCHVSDHLLRSKVMPREVHSTPNKISETGTTNVSSQWIKINAGPVVSAAPRHNTRIRQAPKRLIEE